MDTYEYSYEYPYSMGHFLAMATMKIENFLNNHLKCTDNRNHIMAYFKIHLLAYSKMGIS